MDLNTVSYHVAEACIIEAFRTKKVPYIKGSPGTGKSKLYASIADKYKLKLIDLRLASYEPPDLNGFPVTHPERQKAGYWPMDVFPLDGDPVPAGYKGFLLLLDEINSADRSVIKAAYKLVLDRMIGQFKLHEQCWIAMAGNLDTDNAITEEMGTAMQSRISPHLHLEVNPQQWLEWAHANAIDYRICAFIELRPDLLHDFRPDHVDCTYPCPRSWEMVHDYIVNTDLDAPRLKKIISPILAGTIGSGAALEFIAFNQLFHRLPSFKDILANPESVNIDYSPDIVFALTGLITANVTPDNIDTVLTFVNRLGGDFQALTIKNIRQRYAALTNHPAITNWLVDNAQALVA